MRVRKRKEQRELIKVSRSRSNPLTDSKNREKACGGRGRFATKSRPGGVKSENSTEEKTPKGNLTGEWSRGPYPS